MWRHVDLVWTDIGLLSVTCSPGLPSIFTDPPPLLYWLPMWPTLPPSVLIWLGVFDWWLSLLATCSCWFLAHGVFYPEDGGDTFLWNVGSHKIYMVLHPRRRHFSFKMVSNHCSPLILPNNVYNLRYWQHHKTDHKERKEKKDNQFHVVWIYKTVDFQFSSEEAIKFNCFSWQTRCVACCQYSFLLCDLNSYPGALSQLCKHNEECCVMTTYFFWLTHVSCW
jgi:hypothetical protein